MKTRMPKAETRFCIYGCPFGSGGLTLRSFGDRSLNSSKMYRIDTSWASLVTCHRNSHLFARHPRGDLLARPLMVVVQVDDDDRKSEFLFATFHRTLPDRALETIEEPVQVFRRIRSSHIRGQPVHSVVSSAQRTGGVSSFEVISVGLFGTANCT